MARIRHYLDKLRTTYWFVPAVMTSAAAILALSIVWADYAVQEHWLIDAGWLYTGGAEGARQLLATVAGCMITVAGVVFSITVVALSLASSQFGPRLLRNFMRDRGNQIVLGTFIATFVYCLLVLRTVRGQDGREFIPHLAVTVAVLLALASVAVLIYFIHHTAVSVQAPIIVANVGRELRDSIDVMFPEELGDESHETEPQAEVPVVTPTFNAEVRSICSKHNGYIQLIDEEPLLKLASDHKLVVRVLRRSGHFVVAGDALALCWPPVPSEQEHRIRNAFAIGREQTPTQDTEHVVTQLVEIAVRALSPGINDPFTAIACIDQLGASLSRLARRKMPSPYRLDDVGELRVIANPLTFAGVVDAAFRQIRQYGRGSTAVLVRMLEVIETVLRRVNREEDRSALLRQAELIRQCAEELPQQADREDVRARYDNIKKHVGS
jgi:uncharacterized membrane protein